MTDDDTGLVIEVRVATCRHSELHIRAVETYFWFLYSVLMVALILAGPPPSLGTFEPALRHSPCGLYRRSEDPLICSRACASDPTTESSIHPIANFPCESPRDVHIEIFLSIFVVLCNVRRQDVLEISMSRTHGGWSRHPWRGKKTCARGSTREGFCESTFGLIAMSLRLVSSWR